MTKRTDDTPRFTEADLRKAHRDGYQIRERQATSYKGGYRASFWDLSRCRADLGLTPESTRKRYGR